LAGALPPISRVLPDEPVVASLLLLVFAAPPGITFSRMM
jgi:hypothetical protein